MSSISDYRPDQVLVRLKREARLQPGEVAFEGTQVLDRFDLRPLDKTVEGPILKLALREGQSVEQAIERIGQDERVAYVVPNHLVRPLEEPDDLDGRLYGMHQIQAPQAWERQKGSRSGPLLAVIDSGIDYRHGDLAANLWRNPGEVPGNGIDDDANGVIDDVHGFNAHAGSGDPLDLGGHGTHVSGTIAAVGNNGQGVTGVAQQAQLVGCKFIENGMGDTADAIAALLYADKIGARVTNNSWGSSQYNQALYDTMKASPALHVCAAGNDGANNDVVPVYPAAFQMPNLITVAAGDEQGQLTSFSNYGSQSVHIAAPGNKIYSTLPEDQYGFKSGTSMASPHVAGAALLVATQYPQLTASQLRERLIFSSQRTPALEGRLVNGGGLLNAASALEEDPVAPGAVQELSLGGTVTPRLLPLQWRAGGDDGCLGRAAAYEVRLSTQPLSQDNFDQAPAFSAPPPAASGSLEQLEIPLVPSPHLRTLHVGLRAVDNAGQRGPIEQLAVQVPAARVAFSDDGESGPSQWTSEGNWGLTPQPGRGMVWADSPVGEYACDQHTSLTSQPFSLQGFERPVLGFDCRHDLEINFDKVFLEVAGDGQPWRTLDSYNLRKGWERRQYDLSDFRNQTVQIRFRLKTDADVTKDGFYFDNLVVSEEDPVPSGP